MKNQISKLFLGAFIAFLGPLWTLNVVNEVNVPSAFAAGQIICDVSELSESGVAIPCSTLGGGSQSWI